MTDKLIETFEKSKRFSDTLEKLGALLENDADLEVALKILDFIGLDNIIFIGLVGSQAYGTITEGSDFDLKVLYKLPINHFGTIYPDVKGFNLLREAKDVDYIRSKVGTIVNYHVIDDATFPKGYVNTVKYERNNQDGLLLDLAADEVGHFMNQLLASSPNALELLYLPDDCILYKNSDYDTLLQNRNSFITKQSYQPFTAYAKQQFKKMKGKNKKMNKSPKEMEKRSNPLDFCFIDMDSHPFSVAFSDFLRRAKVVRGLDISTREKIKKWKSEWRFMFHNPHKIPLTEYLENYMYEPSAVRRVLNNWNVLKTKKIGLDQKFCGIAQNDGTETFYLFFDYFSDISFNEQYSEKSRKRNRKKYSGRHKGYKGLLKANEHVHFAEYELKSNELRKSAIPKGDKILAKFSYRKDLYSEHCKEYKEYWDWVKYMNKERHKLNQDHGHNYDSKNAMHMIRILQTYKELLETRTLKVKRENKEELLNIKNGEFSFEKLMELAKVLIDEIEVLYEKVNLLASVNINAINEMLMTIRNFQKEPEKDRFITWTSNSSSRVNAFKA